MTCTKIGGTMIVEHILYGDDIDGNRGMYVWEYTLEEDDREYILTQLADKLLNNGYIEEVETIVFFNPYTEEEIPVDINVVEWLC